MSTEAAGWLVAAALIYAPFALGSVSPPEIAILQAILWAACAFWLASLAIERRLPVVHPAVLACGIIVLAHGWFMAWNARGIWAPGLRLEPISHRPFPGLPGSEEQRVSIAAMIRLSALAGAFAVVSDLAASAQWRRRLLSSIAGTGSAIGVLGLAQALGLGPSIPGMNPQEGIPFATFNYHGNAGAYLNLALPLICSLCMESLALNGTAVRRGIAFGMVTVVLAAAFANSSRGAQAITLALMVMAGARALSYRDSVPSPGGQQRRSLSSSGWRSRRRRIASAVGMTVVALTIFAAGLAVHADKWSQLPLHISPSSARANVWRVAMPMALSAGPFGHGPGVFKILLPRSPHMSSALASVWIVQDHVPGTQVSMWSMAHEDYLQTFVEHGALGSIALAVLFFGGILLASGRAWPIERRGRVRNDAIWAGIAAALVGVALNALFDFPLQVASLQLTTVVLLGICWAASNPRPDTQVAIEPVAQPPQTILE